MWRYVVDGKPSETISDDELARLADTGVVRSDTLVWQEGMTEWQPFAETANGARCGQCEKYFSAADVVWFGGVAVCAACKPVYLQRVQEGVLTVRRFGSMARRRRRLLANIMDTIVVVAILLPIEWFTGAIGRSAQQGPGFAPLLQFRLETVIWGLVSLVLMLTINWRLLAKGQTLGKLAMQLKIVRKNGAPCDRSRIVLRRMAPLWVLSLVPGLGTVAGLIDALSICRTSRFMFHDDIADTKVIDVRPDNF